MRYVPQVDERLINVGDVKLHVGSTGEGPDVVVLTGGPGNVQYLEQDHLAPRGFRSWYPEPRGVGRSGGGPHSMQRGIADLEAIRCSAGLSSWIVVGHSWGSDLAVRYAVEYPESVAAVVGIAGRGAQRDRTWSEEYEAGRAYDVVLDIALEPAVHTSLGASFTEWIHHPELWRRLADCPVPMQFIAAGTDIRPSWPMAQLGELVPNGAFTTVADVPHDFWHTHPDVWASVVTEACKGAIGR